MPVYTLPDLPYDYSALAPVISPEIIELHHDKHHAGYVKGANDTLEQLAEARDKEQWGSAAVSRWLRTGWVSSRMSSPRPSVPSPASRRS